MKKVLPVAVVSVAAFGCMVVLRFWHINLPFFDDEPDWVMYGQRLGLSGVTVHGAYHGPVLVYVLALSRLLFGSTPTGWRILNAVLGCALCVSIYALVQLIQDRLAAALAFVLAAGNAVLVYCSAYACPAMPNAVCLTWCLYFLVSAQRSGRQRHLTMAGVCFGLSVLSYNPSFVLLPAIVVFAAVALRRQFRLSGMLQAAFISALVASPYLYWLVTAGTSYVSDKAPLFGFNLANPSILALFLGQLGVRGASGGFELGFQNMTAPMGILLLVGTGLSVRTWRSERCDARLIALASMIVLSLIVLGQASPRQFNYAVVLAVSLAPSGLLSVSKRAVWAKITVAAVLAVSVYDGVVMTRSLPAIADDRTRLALGAWSREQSTVNLNDLARSTLQQLGQPLPSIIVQLDPGLDALANYITAASGAAAICPLPDNRLLYADGSFIRSMVLLRVAVSASDIRVVDWARQVGAVLRDSDVTIAVPDQTERLLYLPLHVIRADFSAPLTPAQWASFTSLLDN